jgi:CRP/FNR family transcriptional regulator
MKGPNKDQILKIVKAPEYLGIPTTVGDKVNNYSVVAVNEVITCFVDLATFQKLIQRNGNFAYEIVLTFVETNCNNFTGVLTLFRKT